MSDAGTGEITYESWSSLSDVARRWGMTLMQASAHAKAIGIKRRKCYGRTYLDATDARTSATVDAEARP